MEHLPLTQTMMKEMRWPSLPKLYSEASHSEMSNDIRSGRSVGDTVVVSIYMTEC